MLSQEKRISALKYLKFIFSTKFTYPTFSDKLAQEENNLLSCFLKEDNETMDEFVERVFEQFPEIKEKEMDLNNLKILNDKIQKKW